jgi:hypothetical protein
MVKSPLASGLLNDEQKRLLRRRWLNDSIVGSSLSLRAGRFRDALFYFVNGTRINCTWPLKLAKRKFLRKVWAVLIPTPLLRVTRAQGYERLKLL